MLADLERNEVISWDTETTGLYPWAEDARVNSIGFGTKKWQWCLPVSHHESPWSEDELESMLDRIERIILKKKLIAHNGKFDSLWMSVVRKRMWVSYFDTMLGHYLWDENSGHSLKVLAVRLCNGVNYDVPLDFKTGGPLWDHCHYLAHDVFYTRMLYFKMKKNIESDSGLRNLWTHVLMPIARLFIHVELRGVYVDVKQMAKTEALLIEQRDKAQKELYKYGNINWRSPKQVAGLLFGKLGCDILDRTKGGSPSTSESVLLRIDHPVAKALISHREATKNLGTYIAGWKRFLRHGRMHPSFKLHGAVTGRASCEDPNLQATPRNPLLRSLITAPEGWSLLDGDLSQIELRIAAELSGDETLLGIFERDEDAHWMTAIREIARGGGQAKLVKKTARLYLGRKVDYADAIDALYKMGPDKACEIDGSWKELRKMAKAINFGYLFGMWWKKFKIYARDNYGIDVTDKQAQESRKLFFSIYPKLSPWHEKQRRYARRFGYVRSLSGRKRNLPDAQLPHDCFERGEAWRQAINSPVQEMANTLNYMVLLQLCEEFPPDIIRPVGTVHDATLVEVRDDVVPRVYKRWLEIMKKPRLLEVMGIRIRVPIKGDVKIGPWGKGVSLEKWEAQRKAAA